MAPSSSAPSRPEIGAGPPRRRRGCSGCVLTLLTALAVLGTALAACILLSLVVGPQTILVLGTDRRPGETGPVRSDTLLLVAIRPETPKVALLSIPRDLYLDIPGYGQNRVNTALFFGGPALAKQTIAANFGVPVDRWVQVDFSGFRALVDAAGGVDIDVPRRIVDNAYPTENYGTMRIEIPAGHQHMDGETALRYVRTRHDASDFERAARQQQVVLALAKRLLEPSAWPRWPQVAIAFNQAVETDVRPWDVLLIMPALVRVGPDGIRHYVISEEMTTPFTTRDGAQVLLPRWERIRPLVQEAMGQ